MLVQDSLALFALDDAAPVELALAALHQLDLARHVAPPAAQQVAAVDGLGRLVAHPSVSPQRAQLRVWLAEVRGRLHVHQVLLRVRFELRVQGHELRARAPQGGLDLRRPVELLLEDLPHPAESGHGPPARAHLAGSGHPVALALHLHVVLDRLHTHTHRKRQWFGLAATEIVSLDC